MNPDLERLERAACIYAKDGYRVLPLAGKKPVPVPPRGEPFAWKKRASTDPRDIEAWFKQYGSSITGIGKLTGNGKLVLDIDPGKGGIDSLHALMEKHGRLPDTREVTTGSGGRHMEFSVPNGLKIPNSTSALGPGLDIRGDGGYVVAPPSIHPDTGGEYTWDGIEGYKAAIAPAPEWLLELILRTIKDGKRNATLHGIASAMRGRGESEEKIREELYRVRSTRCENPETFPDSEIETIIGSVMQLPTEAEKWAATAVPLVSQNGTAHSAKKIWIPPASFFEEWIDFKKMPEFPDLLGYDSTDTGNGYRITACFQDLFHYDKDHEEWIIWDGRRSVFQKNDQHMRDLTRRTAEEYVRQASKVLGAFLEDDKSKEKKDAERVLRAAMGLQNDGRCTSALNTVKSQPRWRNIEKYDRNPGLICFLNGMIDVKTPEFREHRAADLVSKLIHHNYNVNAQCQRWKKFLRWATCGDEELMAFLQRALGYSITGYTSEKATFFVHGNSGNNGKTTLLATVFKLIPEYATKLETTTLMRDWNGESLSTKADLADLFGARFATVSEPDSGQQLSEGRIKRVTTGSDMIKTQRKYGAPFIFQETHKLWMDANNLPSVRTGGPALWSRILVIPFNAKVQKSEMDKTLQDTFISEEAEGILAWLVEGAIEWMSTGLRPPACVIESIEDYKAEQEDPLGSWLADRRAHGRLIKAQDDPEARVASSDAYSDYADYCKHSKEKRISTSRFKQAMIDKNYQYEHDRDGRWFYGLKLMPWQEAYAAHTDEVGELFR